MFESPFFYGGLCLLLGLFLPALGRRVRWWWLRHRQPSQAYSARFAVYHTFGTERRLYHTSNDPGTAKAHYNSNNAPRGTVIEFYDAGKFRGRRVQG